MATKLDRKHKAMVDRYLVHRDRPRAAMEVGFSKARARVTACEIFARPEVKAYLDKEEEKLNEDSRLAAYLIREELAVLAHSDIRNFVIGTKGKVTLAKGVPEEAWRAVQSIEIEHVGPIAIKTKLRLWPKNDAIRTAAQHLGMLKNHLEVTGKDGGPIEVDTESARLRIADRINKLAGQTS